MGCDIHVVLEKRKAPDAKWIGVWASDRVPGHKIRPARRDYDFFSAVAGVRRQGDGPVIYPRNLPEDVSELAWSEYMQAPTDYHSPSHMTAGEFLDVYLTVNPPDEDERFSASYRLLGIFDDDDDGPEYRVVFWFDN